MDDNGDSGWIKGLPAGWIDGFICARRLVARFRTEHADADPAPWHDVVNADYWGPHFGKTPEEYALNEKLSARLVAVIQKAVCTGQLEPSWFDGSVFKSMPAHAFGNWRIVHGALLNGGFEVDPLWPDEWQHWSNHGWAIPKEQFETWMQTDHALSMAGLPVPDSEMPPCDVVAIASRKPSDASRVALSEAITWIAFGVALDAERLERAIRWESLADGDLQAAQRQMEAATAALLKAGADGLVPLYGRHMEAHGEKGKRTEKIDPLTLEDYRKAWITSQDSLHYGTGLFVWYRAPNDSILRGSERSDHFANVTVEREALLKHCGSRLDSMAALLMPIPAALPGHIVFWVGDLAASVRFYEEVMGFKISDYIAWDVHDAVFLHCNPRHHTLALMKEGPGPAGGMMHIMVEANSHDDVGYAYDIVRDLGIPVMLDPGKHSNDHMQSFYLQTPSGFWIEYGYGGREIGPDWEIKTYDQPMLWGHRPVPA